MTPTAHFSPDREHILSPTKSDVILLAQCHEGEQDEEPCIARITRKLYFQAMTVWLDRKADYHRGGEFAGVGSIYLEDIKLLPAGAYLSANMIKNPPEDLDIDTDGGNAFFRKQGQVTDYGVTGFDVDKEHVDTSVCWRPQYAEFLSATKTTVTMRADCTDPEKGCWDTGECAFRLDRKLYHAAVERYLDTLAAGDVNTSITFDALELLATEDEDDVIDALVDAPVEHEVSVEEFIELMSVPYTGPSTPSRQYGSTATTTFKLRRGTASDHDPYTRAGDPCF